MFNGNFIEGETQAATFPEDSIDAFEMFLTWIYREVVDCTAPPTGDLTFADQLISLMAFADKYQIDTLADNTMDKLSRLQKEHRSAMTPREILSVYEKTSAGSKMRLYAARDFIYVTCSSRLKDISGEDQWWSDKRMMRILKANGDLMQDFFKNLRNAWPRWGNVGIPGPHSPANANACDYHKHGADEPCPHRRPLRQKHESITSGSISQTLQPSYENSGFLGSAWEDPIHF